MPAGGQREIARKTRDVPSTNFHEAHRVELGDAVFAGQRHEEVAVAARRDQASGLAAHRVLGHQRGAVRRQVEHRHGALPGEGHVQPRAHARQMGGLSRQREAGGVSGGQLGSRNRAFVGVGRPDDGAIGRARDSPALQRRLGIGGHTTSEQDQSWEEDGVGRHRDSGGDSRIPGHHAERVNRSSTAAAARRRRDGQRSLITPRWGGRPSPTYPFFVSAAMRSKTCLAGMTSANATTCSGRSAAFSVQ